ncbi:hypothetical protein LCGC14_0141510 [marine sediment metagenome]|uniref:Uncharacterized protein n=1 Tax=marine sediment metagenome TaxID=412755 RepID=A0A0F9VGF4_9ZZZZ
MHKKETGIPCFECGKRSGIDCPGRRPDEATRCTVCMEEFMGRIRRISEKYKDSLKRLADS